MQVEQLLSGTDGLDLGMNSTIRVSAFGGGLHELDELVAEGGATLQMLSISEGAPVSQFYKLMLQIITT